MTNPELPGIPEAGQTLSYTKLDEYNRGRMPYKEAGAYLVVPPRPRHPVYSAWVYSPSFEKDRLLFIRGLSTDVSESSRTASTLFLFSRRCLLIMEYNEKRMQDNGDGIMSFDRYHGHYLHEVLKVDPAYLSWIAYKYTPEIPKQERLVATAQVYRSVHLDIIQRRACQKHEANRFLGSEGEGLEGLNPKVVRVRLEDDPYKTRAVGSTVQFPVQQIVTLTDPSGNLVIMKISSKTPSPVSCQLPALEHEFRLGGVVHITSVRAVCTHESCGSKYIRLSHMKFRQVSQRLVQSSFT